LRILFASDVTIQNIEGGANRVLYEQATGLAARGHEVLVLTREIPGGPSEIRIGSVREHRYPVNRKNPVAFLLSTIRNSRRVFEALSSGGKFDVIHFHQPFSAPGILRSDKSRRVRKVYTCHSFAFEEYETRNPRSGGLSRWLHSWGRRLLEGYALRRVDVILTLSQYMRDKVIRQYGIASGRVEVLAGGVDPARFHPGDDKPGLREKLKLPQGRFILFTVRNLVPRMGLENLIRSMKQVCRERNDPYLIIGGEGPLKKSLEDLIRREGLEGSVGMAGYIPEEDLPSFYRAADWFVLPTICLEGFGLVTLEALASGLPVLGTPVGATPELLGKLDRGLLFKDAEPASLADRIIETWKEYNGSPGEYAARVAKCRSFVEQGYTWQHHLKALELTYEKLLADPKN
jgi:glycosyltransferase involved in cell wall biosynthesis